MRATDFVTETQRMSAAAKLQRAWEREQQKSAASAKRGREYMDQIKKDVADKDKKKDVEEDISRRGFLKGAGAAAMAGAAGKAGAGQYKSIADLNKNPAQLQQVWKPRVDELRNRCHKILKSFIDVSTQSAPDYVKTLQSIQIQVTLGDSQFRQGKPIESRMTYNTKKGQFVGLTSSEIFLEATVFWDAPDSSLAFILGHECGHIIMQHFANPASKTGKDAEYEADLIGAFLAKKIGYSKANLFQFLLGVKADMLKNKPGDEHPEASDRVKFLKQKAGFELSAVKYIDSMVQQFQNGLAEAGNNYHANTTGFAKPKRDDDERHDLDVAQSTIYGLKINGQIWKKDGHVVTFATREKALAARNSIMLKRPELEVGLVQKGSAMESATGGATGSGSIASVAMPLGGKKKKKGGAVNLLGGPVFKR